MLDTGHVNQEENSSGAVALFLRLCWMFLGNLVLGISALLIVQAGASFSLMDIAYWATIPVLVGMRYVDIAKFKGVTAYGDPASMLHWRRYAIGMLLAGTGAWLAAHGAGYLFGK